MSQRPASTIREFCDDYRISERTFYALQKQGRAPRLMKVGRRTLISQEAAAEWRKRMESETAGEKSFWDKPDPELMVL